MEKVSVIITTYKRPLKILKRSLDSVINQTYENIEIIIVNDNPSDKAMNYRIKELLSRYDNVNYLSYEINRGANYARNYGIKYATGKYIAFLDDDDEWLPKKIEMQVKKLKENKQIGIVYGTFYCFNENKRTIKQLVKVDNKNKLSKIVESNFIGSTSFPLFRKEVFEVIGMFDESMPSCQEYELYIRILQKFDISYIEEPLGIYYISNDSTFKNNDLKYINGDMKIISKHINFFKNHKKEFNIHLNNMALYFLRRKKFNYYIKYKYYAIKEKIFSSYNFTVIQIIRTIYFRKINK